MIESARLLKEQLQFLMLSQFRNPTGAQIVEYNVLTRIYENF